MNAVHRLHVIILGIIIVIIQSTQSWQPDIVPKIFIKYDPELPMFFGNQSDYFKILDQDDTTILIGAKNNLYNLSLVNLIENSKRRIEWISSDAHRELCTLKGKQESDCQNYIRVYAKITDTQLMICGTNSYKPLCRYYNVHLVNDSGGSGGSNSNELELINEIEAQGRCPYNPIHNSTYVFTDGQLYSATVADFSGSDPLIYRESQRTEQYDLKQLNQPAFINAVEHNGYVFIFFREIAMEHMNCGKAIYSRIGRVCKNDKGGPYKFSQRWTSFLKARLNCSVPGDYPFYFDEIQATSKIIVDNTTSNAQQLIYVVFTTSPNAIAGSAVCVYTLSSIMDAFDGLFKSQKDSTSNWLPLSIDQVPEPRPGKCVDDSRTLPSFSVNFIKMNTLMETAVPAMYGRPILTRVNLKQRLTAIAVDPQIPSMDHNVYDVIFVGTDDGRVIKFIYANRTTMNADEQQQPQQQQQQQQQQQYNHQHQQAIIISETQALPSGVSVKELTVSRVSQSLIVVGDGHILAIPLHYCSKIIHCRDCFALRDPYCVWDINNQECTSRWQSNTNTYSTTTIGSTINGNNAIDWMAICKKRIVDQTPVIIESFKKSGTSGSNVGITASNTGINSIGGTGTITSIGQSLNINDNVENEITMITIDGSELTNQINSHKTHIIDPLVKEPLGGGGGGNDTSIFQLANPSIIVVMCVLFVAGLTFGFFLSKFKVKFSPCYMNEHRNQLTGFGQKRHLRPLNASKDINLLMDNSFSTTCNNKKDNLDQVFTKDRSHECKNSTENLEKDLQTKSSPLERGGCGNSGDGNCSSSGTSLKVIKTYL